MADAADLEKWRELAVREEKHTRGLAKYARYDGDRDRLNVEAERWRALGSFLEQMEGLAGRGLSVVCGEVWWRCAGCSIEYEGRYAPTLACPNCGEHTGTRTSPPTTAPVEVDEERSKT